MRRHLSTDEARQILWRFFKREGRLPSYGEMCPLFGYASKQAAYRLAEKLIKDGALERGSQGKLLPKKLTPPIKLLGEVQAGFPSPAEEELLDTLSMDDYLITKPEATFLVQVVGDSMIDEGIKPRDLVLVERGKVPKNGDVVLAEIDGEWTLKYFEKRRDRIRLVPGNKKYPPLYPKTQLTLGGVVVGVVRKYCG